MIFFLEHIVRKKFIREFECILRENYILIEQV